MELSLENSFDVEECQSSVTICVTALEYLENYVSARAS